MGRMSVAEYEEFKRQREKIWEEKWKKKQEENRNQNTGSRKDVMTRGEYEDFKRERLGLPERKRTAFEPIRYFFEDALQGMRVMVNNEVERKQEEKATSSAAFGKFYQAVQDNPSVKREIMDPVPKPKVSFGQVYQAASKSRPRFFDADQHQQEQYILRPEKMKQRQEEIERRLTLLEAQKAERDMVIQTYPNYTGGSYGYSDYVEKAKKAREERLKPYEGLDEKISALEKERDNLKYLDYQLLSQRPDFVEKSQLKIGESSNYTKALDYWDYIAKHYGASEKESKRETLKMYGQKKFGDITLGDFNAMTDSEVNIYHYLLHSEGEKSADNYLHFMAPTLRYRQGQVRADLAIDRGFFGGAGLAVESGLSQFGGGLIGAKNAITGNDSKLANLPGLTQYASSIYREGLNRFQKLPYDLATTTVNMAPSIAVSAVNPVAGSALSGMSAGGNAYSQSIQEGKEWGDALLYGALVGASESLMIHALGGVTNAGKGVVGKLGNTKMGQKVGHVFDSALSRVVKNNTFRRAAQILGSRALAEGTEEYIQDIVNPIFRNVSFDEKNEVPLFTTDAAYSFLLGALSGGIFAIRDTVAARYTEPTLGDITGQTEYFKGVKDIQEAKKRFRELAKEYHPDSGTDTADAAIFSAISREYGRITSDWQAIQHDVVHDTQDFAGFLTGPVQEGRGISLEEQALQEMGVEVPAEAASSDLTRNPVMAVRPAEETIRQTIPGSVRDRALQENSGRAVRADEGALARPKGFESVSKRDAMVNLSDGTTKSLSDVVITDPSLRTVYRVASKLDTATAANSLVNNYDGKTNAASYAESYLRAYTAGVNGKPFESVSSLEGRFIDAATLKEAYYQGQGAIPVRQEYNTGREMQKRTKEIAKALGKRVRFVDTISTGDGRRANGALVDGEILIARDSDNPASVVFSHEVTHLMQESSPEEYQAYKDYVVSYFRESHPDEYYERIQDLKDLYKTDDVSFLEDELVSNATETFLMDEKAVDSLIRENRSVARKLLDSIKAVIAKIKGLLSGYEAQSPEAKLLAADLEKFEKARDLWMKGLMKPQRQSAKVEGGPNSRQSIRLTDADTLAYLDAGGRTNKNKLEAYNAGKQIILRSDTEIKAYVDNILENGDQGVPTVAYGKVNDRLAAAVRENSGGDISVDGLYLEFVPADISHAYKGHSTAKQEGNIPLSKEIFEQIPDILDSFSEVVYVRKFKSGNTRVVTGTKTDAGIVVIVETVSKSRGALQFKNVIGMTEEAYESYYADELQKSRANSGGNPEGSRYSLRDASAFDNSISNPDENVNGRFSLKKDMTESERTEELKKMTLEIASYDADKMSRADFDVEQLVNTYKSQARELIRPLAERFGVFKSYRNEHVELEFQYSRSSLDESLHKQDTRTKEFDSFAKMLSCFDQVLENAQPVYIHDDKYRGTRREEPQIKQVYVLVSAYRDTDMSLVPVELLVKEYWNIKNKLYVSVTMNSIKEADLEGTTSFSEGEGANIPKSASLETSLEAQPELSKGKNSNNAKLVSIITLPELFSKINPKDGDFLKYIPDDLLNPEQLVSKRKAQAEEDAKIESLRVSLKDTQDTSSPEGTPYERMDTILAEGFQALGKKNISRKNLGHVADRIIKEYSSQYSAETLADNLQTLFAYIQSHEGKVDYQDMMQIMAEVAKPVLEQSRTLDRSTEQDYQRLQDYLKGKKIRLNEQQKAEINYSYGSYNQFRKDNFGRIRLSEDGVALDEIWDELCDLMPEHFDSNTHEVAQVFEILDTLQALKPTWKNDFNMDTEEAAYDLGLRLYHEYFKYQSGQDVQKVRDELNQQLLEVRKQAKKSGESKVEKAKKRDRAYQQAKKGFIPKGENPVRDVDVPLRSNDGRKVRRFVRTVLESQSITDEMVAPIQDKVLKGAMSYTPASNGADMQNAKGVVERMGLEGARRRWEAASNGNRIADHREIAIGEALLREYAKAGDAANVIEMTASLAANATKAGQAAQASRMMKQMENLGELTYVADLYTVQKATDDINRQLEKRFRGRKEIPQIQVNEELAQQFAKAKTPEERQKLKEKIYADLGEQLPSTWVDKWNAWRYLSMLGNPRTHIRNLTGNAIFMPAIWTKNTIAYGLESAFLQNQERSKSLIVGKKYKRYARESWQEVKDIVASGGKYNDSNRITENQRVFKFTPLEWLRKQNYRLLEGEDALFLRHHYQRALGQYLQANKVDLENADQAVMDRAIAYAIKEAHKATYRDASAFATTISRAFSGNQALGLFIEGVLPFKKTPINILKRGVEYSPAGLIQAITRGTKRLAQKKITPAEYIDQLASGLTGTGVVALGAFLASTGFLMGGFGDDEEDDLKKLTGEQEYSVRIGDISFTVDWAAPISLPLFVGAELHAAMEGEWEDATFADYVESLTKITEPMFNLSMMSSLNDMLSAVKRSDNPLTEVGKQAVLSYLQQAFPTIGGQIARTIDPISRRNSTDKNSQIPGDAQYFIQKVMGKIPTLSSLKEPRLNAWGEEDVEDNVLLRAFENFISPAYISRVEESDVEKELGSLLEDGVSGVVPKEAEDSFKINGVQIDLTPKQYTEYQKKLGGLSYDILNELIDMSEYDALEMGDRGDVVKLAYDYANKAVKHEMFDAEFKSSWAAEIYEASQSGESLGKLLMGKMQDTMDEEEVSAARNEFMEALSSGKGIQKKVDLYFSEKVSKGNDEKKAASDIKGDVTEYYKSTYINANASERARIEKELLSYKVNGSALYEKKEFLQWRDGGQYGSLKASIESGNGIQSSVKELMDYGVSGKSIASQITKLYKDEYVKLYRTNRGKAANLKAYILTAYQSAGYDRAKKSKDIDRWLDD